MVSGILFVFAGILSTHAAEPEPDFWANGTTRVYETNGVQFTIRSGDQLPANSTYKLTNSPLPNNVFLQFGEYPRSYVGNTLNTTLETAFGQNQVITTGKTYSFNSNPNFTGSYPTYSTASEYSFNNIKYVRHDPKVFDNSGISHAIDENGALLNDNQNLFNQTNRWFRVEPINWLIANWANMPASINPNGDGLATYIELLSVDAIMAGINHGPNTLPNVENPWLQSYINYYLNYTWIDEAFETNLQSIIPVTSIKNNSVTSLDTNGINTPNFIPGTYNKIFLLSTSEIWGDGSTASTKYNTLFTTDILADETKKVVETDWTYANYSYPAFKLSSSWTTRTPIKSSNMGMCHIYNGALNADGAQSPLKTIRPAMFLTLGDLAIPNPLPASVVKDSAPLFGVNGLNETLKAQLNTLANAAQRTQISIGTYPGITHTRATSVSIAEANNYYIPPQNMMAGYYCNVYIKLFETLSTTTALQDFTSPDCWMLSYITYPEEGGPIFTFWSKQSLMQSIFDANESDYVNSAIRSNLTSYFNNDVLPNYNGATQYFLQPRKVGWQSNQGNTDFDGGAVQPLMTRDNALANNALDDRIWLPSASEIANRNMYETTSLWGMTNSTFGGYKPNDPSFAGFNYHDDWNVIPPSGNFVTRSSYKTYYPGENDANMAISYSRFYPKAKTNTFNVAPAVHIQFDQVPDEPEPPTPCTCTDPEGCTCDDCDCPNCETPPPPPVCECTGEDDCSCDDCDCPNCEDNGDGEEETPPGENPPPPPGNPPPDKTPPHNPNGKDNKTGMILGIIALIVLLIGAIAGAVAYLLWKKSRANEPPPTEPTPEPKVASPHTKTAPKSPNNAPKSPTKPQVPPTKPAPKTPKTAPSAGKTTRKKP